MPSVVGLASGLDTTSLIQQMIAIQQQPINLLRAQVTQKTAQQTEFGSLTSQILALKTKAGILGQSATFEAKKGVSSNESVLGIAVDTDAAEGSYTFTVGKLARTSQMLSGGFAASDTAIGKGNITFETGNGFVDRKTRVDALNGGTGIERGSFKLTDGDGNDAMIDVSAAATLQDILDAINTGGTKITASLSADGLVLTDASAAPSITVAALGGKTTAADLGLIGRSTLNGRLTGSRINLVAGATRLDDLNDGNGVRTSLDAGTGAAANDLRFTLRDGTVFDVNLDSAAGVSPATIQDVLNAINNASGNGGKLTASISTDQQSLTMLDNTAGATAFAIAGLNSSNGYVDLGLRGVTPERTTDGTQNADGNRIVGKRILSALNSVLAKTLNGGVRQSPSADTNGVTDGSIAITDRAGTATTVNLSSRVATTTALAALSTATSLTLTSAEGFAAGNLLRVTNGTSTVLRRITSVNYGTNVVSFDQELGVAIGLGSGAYASNESLSDITNGIAGRTGDVVTGSFNAARNGLKLLDASGGTGLLRIRESGSTTAADLGLKTADVSAFNPDAAGTTTTFVDAALAGLGDSLIGLQVEVTAGPNSGYSGKILDFDSSTNTVTLDTAATAAFDTGDTYRITGVNAASYDGRDTDPAYLTERSFLSSLNGGNGVFAGSIRITDRQGLAFTVDLSQSTDTRIYNVINDINGAASGAGSALVASLNATGDGILLTSASGSGTIKVEEVSGGTTAKDLGLLGSSSTATLDGSFEKTLTVGASDTLETVRDAINAMGIPVTASIIMDGSPTAPYRLNLTGTRSGLAGKLVVDPQRLNISFQNVSEGEDAALLFGSGAGGGSPVLFTSDSNTVSNVVPGLTLTLKSASTTPVTATVTRDTEFIADQVNDFVTGFNDTITKVKADLHYDPEEESRGVLLGNQSARNLEFSLYSMVLQRVPQLPSSLNGLDKVGVKLGQDGTFTFDRAKFLDEVASDFKGVKKLFVSGADIATGTALSTLNRGDGVRIKGSNLHDFKILTRSGDEIKVSLSDATIGETTSIGGVISAINNATGNGGKITASVSSDGSGITLVDTSVGTDNTVLSALNGSLALGDLGLQKSASYVSGSSSTTLKGNALNTGGIGGRMEDRLDFIGSDEHGILPSAKTNLDTQIEDLNEHILDLQARLDLIQKRLEDQFIQLEATLANLQSTASFLTAQFATWSNPSPTTSK